MTAPIIDRFYVRGEGHNPLSNFWIGAPIPAAPFGTEYGDRTVEWMTSEHYYQAAKFYGEDDIMYVAAAHSPGESKRRGNERRPTFRKDWEAIKFGVMREALALKFNIDRPEAQYLLDTGEALLIEGNEHNDRFWGAERDKLGNYTIGENWLGWLLMAQRSYLRSMLAMPHQMRLEFGS